MRKNSYITGFRRVSHYWTFAIFQIIPTMPHTKTEKNKAYHTPTVPYATFLLFRKNSKAPATPPIQALMLLA
jgi:hypothetical protein